jgi:putative hydrolase of the HAD superfamily
VSGIKTLWIREPYLEQILGGRKRIEVRVGYDNIRRLRPGDRLRLNNRHLVSIARVGLYNSFEELLAHESPTAMAPDLSPGELLGALRQIYPAEKEMLGVVALELSLHRYDALLFDLGYTLVYFDPSQEIVVQKALRDAGVERSVAEIEAAAGVVWGEYYRDAATATFPATEEYDRETELGLTRSLLAELGLESDEGRPQTYADFVESAFKQPGAIRVYPDVRESLEALREQGYRLGIVSNWSWTLRDRVAQVGVDGFFEIIWASAYAGCNKPHPDVFLQAIARMQPPTPLPNRVLYVGDSYQHDVVGARNAGLDVVLLDRNGSAGEVDCTVINSLPGLLEILEG